MSRLWQAKLICLGVLIALTACNDVETGMTEACEMKIEVLESRRQGPFALEIIGTPTLCLEAEGDSNLGPFTATARITNRGAVPVAVTYQRGVSSAFQSASYWPEGRRDAATAFMECCGDTQSGSLEQTVLGVGDELLVSSWTRHHNAIWSEMAPGLSTVPAGPERDYVVRFTLDLSYDAGTGPMALSEAFDIVLRAVPAGSN